jgi:Zn-dependent peptidase ImmA (M78 family)
MSPAAQLAALITQRFVKSAPPDLAALCKELGLRVKEVPARGFDGALVRSKTAQKGIIAVKSSLREKSRKRFTVAHEIGHFVLPHHRLLKAVCDEKKIDSYDARLNRPEVEANEFASELLLPSAVLSQKFNLSLFSLSQISAIASEFETSLTATIRCFLRLTALPCAMVWSPENQAPWCARSDSFRFFLPLEELPAEGSHAAGLLARTPAPPDFAPVPAGVWLDDAAAERVRTLLEHSIYLPNYRAVLTLLWAQIVE